MRDLEAKKRAGTTSRSCDGRRVLFVRALRPDKSLGGESSFVAMCRLWKTGFSHGGNRVPRYSHFAARVVSSDVVADNAAERGECPWVAAYFGFIALSNRVDLAP